MSKAKTINTICVSYFIPLTIYSSVCIFFQPPNSFETVRGNNHDTLYVITVRTLQCHNNFFSYKCSIQVGVISKYAKLNY